MYLYLTLLLDKCLSMHLYLTLLLVSWPKDPLGGKTEYAGPRLQEATFLFQADTVEVQHGARFFSLLQTNISCLPLCSFLENWFCCLFVPPLGARLNRLPPRLQGSDPLLPGKYNFCCCQTFTFYFSYFCICVCFRICISVG